MTTQNKSPFYTKQVARFAYIREMLEADYCDAVDYISNYTLKQLRDTKMGYQTLAYAMSLMLSAQNPSLRSIYNFCNRYSTGFHEGVDLQYEINPLICIKNIGPVRFTESDYQAIEKASGSSYAINEILDYHNHLTKCFDSRTNCITAIANIMTVMNVVAHLVSRANPSQESLNYCYNLLVNASRSNVDISVTMDLISILKAMPTSIKSFFNTEVDNSLIMDHMVKGATITLRATPSGNIYLSNEVGAERHLACVPSFDPSQYIFSDYPCSSVIVQADSITGFTFAYNQGTENILLQGNINPDLLNYIWQLNS